MRRFTAVLMLSLLVLSLGLTGYATTAEPEEAAPPFAEYYGQPGYIWPAEPVHACAEEDETPPPFAEYYGQPGYTWPDGYTAEAAIMPMAECEHPSNMQKTTYYTKQKGCTLYTYAATKCTYCGATYDDREVEKEPHHVGDKVYSETWGYFYCTACVKKW